MQHSSWKLMCGIGIKWTEQHIHRCVCQWSGKRQRATEETPELAGGTH